MKSSKKTVINGTEQLTLKSGMAKSVFKQAGDLGLKEMNVNAEATVNLKLKGAQIAQN